MKRFSLKNYLFSGILIICTISVSCKKEEPGSATTSNVNRFIKDCFEVFYLWNDQLPKIDIKKESDPFVLFDKMKYKDDRWSTLTDNVQAMEESFAGEETTFGYSLEFKHSQSKGYFGVVQYVHPNSPAQLAGLERGNIITKVNGNGITQSNYRDLYYNSSVELEMGIFENGIVHSTGRKISMTAVKSYMNPIIESLIIDKGAHKIGYLHYSNYLLKSHKELETVLTDFKENKVTDVVLDLRYNGGGYSITSQYLCSMLLSKKTLTENNIYLQQVWNNDYAAYYKEKGIDINEYFTDTIKYMGANEKLIKEAINVNLNLSSVYILTGGGTASASEATIVGLMPYIDVVTIGSTTHGKFCGGSILSPETIYKASNWYNEIKNWGAYIMLYRYANTLGYPDHTNGLVPNYTIEEDIVRYPYALGDENEPLLAKAIELITGTQSGSPIRKVETRNNYRSADELEIPKKALNGKMIGDRPGFLLPLE